MSLPPIVTIIGRKNAGKTTLAVRLCAELARRGLRVMTVKHGSHTFNIDPSTTDTYRHYHEGGAARVAMVSPDKFALVARHDVEPTVEDVVARHMADADIVVCEGFKRTALPKIEVHRRSAHPAPLFGSGIVDDATVRALVTDDSLQLSVPCYPLDATERLADFVLKELLTRHATS